MDHTLSVAAFRCCPLLSVLERYFFVNRAQGALERQAFDGSGPDCRGRESLLITAGCTL